MCHDTAACHRRRFATAVPMLHRGCSDTGSHARANLIFSREKHIFC